tara:strand:+ start:798 stop:1052 length:255 start_codon:yes stop_codon:yes gene_type:complete
MENKYEIFTVKDFSGNAYVMETTMSGACEVLWTTAILENGLADHRNWSEVDSTETISEVLDSNERFVVGYVRVDTFNKFLTEDR